MHTPLNLLPGELSTVLFTLGPQFVNTFMYSEVQANDGFACAERRPEILKHYVSLMSIIDVKCTSVTERNPVKKFVMRKAMYH